MCRPAAPRSEWCTTRRSGRRRSNAMTSASVTSSAFAVVPMAQPTTRRDHRSMTAARCSQPSPVRNWVTSAVHNRSGPVGLKLRSTRSGARAVSGSAASPVAAGIHPDELLGAHQASDPLAATAPPEPGQLGMHPGCAVGAPRPVVDLHDHLGELGVAHQPRRGRPAEPGVEPRS
jgi:hypothetical protein